LESWKEIATHLKRDMRTVQRWEKREGLPVYRDAGGGLATVYAYRSEIDAWWSGRYRRSPSQPQIASAPAGHRRWLVAVAIVLATVGLPALWWFHSQARKSDGVTLRRVWAEVSGSNNYGSVSLDGRYLSFGMRRIGLRDLASGQDRYLTPRVEGLEGTYSVPSPDGSRVAFTSIQEDGALQQLRLAGQDGSPPRILYADAGAGAVRPFEWSSDGKWILAIINRRPALCQIVLFSSSDGSMRLLRTVHPPAIRASLSPDARYVVYERRAPPGSQQSDLFVFPTAAGDTATTEGPLIEHPAHDALLGWAPWGDRILFTSDRAGTTDVWMTAVAAGRNRGEPEVVRREVGAIDPKGFTRQGAFCYSSDWGQSSGSLYIARLDLLTGRVLAAPSPVSDRFPGSNFSGDWSPDGKSIAYHTERPEKRVVVRSLDSGLERSLPNIDSASTVIRWSPDGRSVLLLGHDKKGQAGAVSVNVETGQSTILAALKTPLWPLVPKELQNPIWSDGGRKISFIRLQGETSHIIERDPQTGAEKHLHSSALPLHHDRMEVSADGQWLAFGLKKTRGGRPQILMVMPARGGSPRELLNLDDPRYIVSIAWFPDGRNLLLSLRDAERRPDGDLWHRLWKISAEGGQPQPTELTLRALRDVRVHPDGRRIAFRTGGAHSEVWMMENFLPRK